MSSGVTEATEDSEDSSSPIEKPSNMLEQFREQWQEELMHNNGRIRGFKIVRDEISDEYLAKTTCEQDEEEKAKSLFAQAAEMERLGKVFEAMRLYRRAIQIVPDIEIRMYEKTKVKDKIINNNANKIIVAEDLINSNKEKSFINDQDDENLDGIDLMERFQYKTQKTGRLFQRLNDDNVVVATGSNYHISDLPIEIIFYILRWVVSSDLDLRSLDTCSLVSKGFYICANDPDIWRLVCVKIWGANVGTLKSSPFNSWRQMCMERHRVHFNGCYISKTNYFRYGENSFQDTFYRPVQLIEYYRYIRLFPDGHALMMTSTDEPAQGVTKLKFKHTSKNEVRKGHYRLQGDMIRIALKRDRALTRQLKQRRDSTINENHTFFLEFKIVSSSKRKFNQLQWKHYSIIQSDKHDEITTEFEITSAKYPSLYFSRVKSYHLVSEHPLQ